MRDEVWKPCPERVVGKRKCETCRNREGSFVYTSFDGFNTENLREEDLEKIAGEHWVYLALFQREAIKIGVCKKDRKELRQLEQGSHATLFIAHTQSGVQARQIETIIRNGGLADKISPNQKKEFVLPHLTNDECAMILKDTYHKYKTALEDFSQLAHYLLPEGEFHTWGTHYQLHNLESDDKPYHYVKLGNDEMASGKILTIKGPFIVIDTEEELVCICTKDLLGRQIEFEPQPAGLRLNSAFQSALF